MEKLKSLEILINNFKVNFLCLFALIWSFNYVKITEFFTFDKNILAQKQSKNGFYLLIVMAVCFFFLYFANKQKPVEIILKEKYQSLKTALGVAAWFHQPEYQQDVCDDLIYNFKKDYLKGGFYGAKYMLWRDNFETLCNFIRVNICKFLS